MSNFKNIMVEKRDGNIVDFDFNKIKIAISKAINALNKVDHSIDKDKIDELYIKIDNTIKDFIKNSNIIDIETIQDIVIKSMKEKDLNFLAYLYKNFRESQSKKRDIFEERISKIISKYINKNTWEIKENSNMQYSVQGLNIHLFSKFNKTYWKREVFGNKLFKYHESGDFHIHDLYLLAPYCVGWDLKTLLLDGFSGVSSKVECYPPKHFDSACGQLVNFLYTMQGEAAGAVAFSNVDTYLAPFIEKDNLHNNTKLLDQYMQKLIYNLNVPTRVGFQCLSNDTEILKSDGTWVSYSDLNIDDEIYVFDRETKTIKTDTVLGINVYKYKGTMCNFISNNMDQLVTPTHNTIAKDIVTEKYELIHAAELLSKAETFISLIVDFDVTNNPYYQEEDIATLAYVNDYDNVVWCPTTETGTVIARRNSKTFITGNSPFTNFTLDLECPEHLKHEPIVIDGKYDDKKTYGEFQEGMNAFNNAFCKIMEKGDKNNKIFSFPIPTYCIDKNFKWDKEEYKSIWKMTAKFGIPYFANYINSDLSKEDSMSMCPLAGDEYVLVKSLYNDKIFYLPIKDLEHNKIYKVYSDGKFVNGRFQVHDKQPMLLVTLSNGHKIKISTNHLNYILRNKESNIEEIIGSELNTDMYLPYSLNEYISSYGNYDIGYLLGVCAAKGIVTNNVLTLELNNEDTIIKDLLIDIIKKNFCSSYSVIKNDDGKYILKIKSKSVIGIYKDFIIDSKNKIFSPNIFIMSKYFKSGFIHGYSNIHSRTNNEIYTESENVVRFFNMLAATLGAITHIETFSKNDTRLFCLCVLDNIIDNDNMFRAFNKIWVKINKIEPLTVSTGYCFEVIDDEPMFTVGTSGILTHNCRLRLSLKELRKRGGGLFGANALTGSMGVVTINLPRIGHLAKNKQDFLDRLKNQIDRASDILIKKSEFVETMTENNLYPYSKHFLRFVKQRYGRYWANHFLTIGIIGMHEACINFFKDPEGIESKEGYELTIETMNMINEYLIELQNKTGYFYNLEAAPAESTGYKLFFKDKKIFSDMYCFKNNNEMLEYTNSTNLPVDTEKHIFAAVKHQSEIQSKYTGGTVFHCYLNQNISDYRIIKNLIKKILTEYKLPYFSITPTFSICPNHGYIPGNVEYCQICNEKTQIYSRVVGYIKPVKNWNIAKRIEFSQRKTFKL